jgi:hypothetical protein
MADSFPLGSIPPLSAWEGAPLSFAVTSSLGDRTVFTKRAIPSPKGRTSIDERTGVFTYEPSPEDKEEFAVWIRARKGAKEESQKVSITPHWELLSEFNVIEHASEKPPDPASRFYTTFSQEDAGEIRFNQIEEVGKGNTAQPKVMTKKVTVSGVRLVIEESKDDGSLYNRLKDRDNLRQLTLCADEVVIRCELKLPGTDVHIYARRLRFDDPGAGKIARIDTSPLAFKAVSTRDDGLDGQKAGDVYLFVKTLETPGNAHRIIANGSKGQSGSHGQPGENGTSVPKWNGKFKVENKDFDISGDFPRFRNEGFDETPIFVKVYEKVGNKTQFRFDSPAGIWPTDGKNPVRLPGRPGRGGDGGSVFTQLKDDLANRVQLNRGEAGDSAAKLEPSKPGEPPKSLAAQFIYEKTIGGPKQVRVLPIDARETRPGKGAEALQAKAPPANPGEIKPLSGKAGQFSWLHPSVVRALIAYSVDAYLSGHTKDVRELLGVYLSAVEGAGKIDKDELTWPLLHNDLAALTQRIESPYDYFGNPAGWVPMLSFQANHKLFKNELESAVRAMFLAYWIQYTQDRAQDAAKILDAAKQHLRNETDQALADYNAAELKITGLETEVASIGSQIEQTRKLVAGIKDNLTKQVKDDLQTEHLLRASAKILGGVMQLIPVGQPVLGSFGKALTVLGDVDIDKPADSLGGVAGAFAPVATEVIGPKIAEKAKAMFSGLKQKEKLEEAREDVKKEEKNEAFKKELAKKEVEKKVKDLMDKKEKAKDTIIGAFSEFAVSEDDIKERLEKVLADTPAYKEAVTEIESLNKRKGAFTEELFATIQAIDVAATTIVNNQLAILELHDQRDRKLEHLNLEALQCVQDMGRRARERLLLYQYYLLKSYHYLMLEDLPIVDFKVQKLFDAFVVMVVEKDGKSTTVKPLSESSNGMLTADQYQSLSAVFEDQLREIAKRIIGWYQEHKGRRLSSLLVELTPNQVETLNSEAKRVEIDLLWELDRQQEDVRITGIEADSVGFAEPLPTRAANLSLEYVHDGVSKLRRDGQLYLFRSGQYRIEGKVKKKGSDTSGPKSAGDSRTDIHWGTKVTYNPNPGENKPKLTVTTTEPDPEEESLVRYLIGADTSDQSPMMSFRPGAWARLAVKRSGAESAKIKHLTLKVNYVFQSVNDDRYSTVAVRVVGEAQPYIRSTALDANGRGDGVGSFLRTFNKNRNKVTLTAPSRYGRRMFLGWRIGAGAGEDVPFLDKDLTPGQDLVLDLRKSPDYVVGPVYAPVNFVPVNGEGEDWPACPVGWVFDDWVFLNNSKASIQIRKIDVDPFKDVFPDKGGFAPVVSEPQGTNITKLSFNRLTLLPRESARLSVCINPEFPDVPQVQVNFVWQESGSQTYYCFYFDGKGRAKWGRKWQDSWTTAEQAFDFDATNRTLTFHP